jgi:hypothetical protein
MPKTGGEPVRGLREGLWVFLGDPENRDMKQTVNGPIQTCHASSIVILCEFRKIESSKTGG